MFYVKEKQSRLFHIINLVEARSTSIDSARSMQMTTHILQPAALALLRPSPRGSAFGFDILALSVNRRSRARAM